MYRDRDGQSDEQSAREKKRQASELELVDLHEPSRASTNPFDRDEDQTTDEEAGHTSPPQTALQYLSAFSREQLIELETQHGMSRQQLDDLVRDHKYWYGVFLVDNVFGIATTVASTPFQSVTGRDGFQSGARLIQSDLRVSDTFGLAVSTPLALLETAYKIATVSARQEAVKRTLRYALRDSFKERFDDFLVLAHDEPAEALGVAVRWGFNQTVIYSHSILYGLTHVLAFYEPIAFNAPFAGEVTIPAWLPQLPLGAQIGVAAGLTYGGHRYASLISTPAYEQNSENFLWKGIEDLWNSNPEGEPWMVGELLRGNISTPVQVAVRGLGGNLLTRAYPRFYNIAQTAFERMVGLDSETSAALAATTTSLVSWQVFCEEYPKSYRRYMADHIRIEAILRKRLEDSIGRVVDQLVEAQIDGMNLALAPPEIKKRKLALRTQIMKDFVETDRRLLQAQVMEGLNDYFAFEKDPSLKPQLVAQALLGLYLGGSTVGPLVIQHVNAPISMMLLSLSSVSGLLTTTCYQAEKQRQTNHLVRQKIDEDLRREEKAAAGRAHKPDSVPIGALIISRNVSQALSVLGAGKRSFGDGNRFAMATAVFFLAENLMESLLLSYKNAQTAIGSWSCCRRKKPSQLADTRGTFFDQGSPRAVAERKATNAAPSTPASGLRSWLPRWVSGE